MNLGLHQTLHHAVDQGIEAYVTSRRARISLFIDQHFSVRGALALHRKTFGRDMYKAISGKDITIYIQTG